MAVNQCTGVLLPPAARTPEQQARLARFRSLTTLPENFVQTVMFFGTFGLDDIVHDKLNGKIGTGNACVDYGDAEINDAIERVTPNRGAANCLARNYTPTGDVGHSKIVSMHTDKDGLAIVENESDYASKVPAANFTSAVVVEDVRRTAASRPLSSLRAGRPCVAG